MEALDQIRKRLAGLVDEDEIEPWLNRPCPAFQGRKPIDLIKAGEAEKVQTLLSRLEHGGPL